MHAKLVCALAGGLAALAPWAPPARAQLAPAPNPRYYIMQCRGPLHLQTTAPGGVALLVLHFTPAAGASGERGEGLRSGECAFLDRTLRATEPRRIRWELEIVGSSIFLEEDRVMRTQIIQQVTACQSSSCVLRVPVQNWGPTFQNYFVTFPELETYFAPPR